MKSKTRKTQPKIPVDMKVGNTLFQKGVKVSTVQNAIDRLFKRCTDLTPPLISQKKAFELLMGKTKL